MQAIIEQVRENVINGNQAQAEAQVGEALAIGVPAREILEHGLIAAMAEVGARFERGEFYVPEMLIAARAMKAGLAPLRPHLTAQGVQAVGRVVLGTVRGDLHDIGKNLVGVMLEGAGFEVVDLGVDVPPEEFARAAREFKPNVIGLSALLTTTMQNMKSTIEAIEDVGLRQETRVIIGGAAVTEAFAREIGADGYAPDASSAVGLAQRLLG